MEKNKNKKKSKKIDFAFNFSTPQHSSREKKDVIVFFSAFFILFYFSLCFF